MALGGLYSIFLHTVLYYFYLPNTCCTLNNYHFGMFFLSDMLLAFGVENEGNKYFFMMTRVSTITIKVSQQ